MLYKCNNFTNCLGSFNLGTRTGGEDFGVVDRVGGARGGVTVRGGGGGVVLEETYVHQGKKLIILYIHIYTYIYISI